MLLNCRSYSRFASDFSLSFFLSVIVPIFNLPYSTQTEEVPCSFVIFSCSVLPHIHPFAFEEEANSGDSVQLTCHASKGDLPLTIKWLHNSRPLFSHLGVLTNKIGDRISLLTIPSVKGQNSGDYTCVVQNIGGQVNYTARLYVNGESHTHTHTTKYPNNQPIIAVE